jgi:excisionase family DNA binding protein
VTSEQLRKKYLTVAEVQDRLHLAKSDSVLKLIHSGALRAVNIAAGSRRALWRISEADLDAFLASRQAQPEPSQDKRNRRRRQAAAVTNYF